MGYTGAEGFQELLNEKMGFIFKKYSRAIYELPMQEDHCVFSVPWLALNWNTNHGAEYEDLMEV